MLNEISHWLSGVTCLSKLDAKDSFWSIHLNERSSYQTTLNTHHGWYHFLFMPFSLKMSQDIFQMQMDQTTDCLPGIITIHDNICMYGHTPNDNMALSSTVQSVRSGNPKIAFYHAVFTDKACSLIPPKSSHPRPPQTWLPCKTSVLPKPDNYLQPSIPSLLDKTMFLWEQLTQWDWNFSMDAAFQLLKTWIFKFLLNTTLAYYDWSKLVIVQINTSEYGLGAAPI